MSLSPEQLELRKTGIGASEAAAAIGIDPYKTPLQLWMEKTGKEAPEEPGQAAYWGHRLESVVLDEYATRMGVRESSLLSPNETIRSSKWPHMLATPDGYAWRNGSDEGRWLIQAKTTGMWMFQKWGASGTEIRKATDAAEIVPEEKVVQVHHEMIVTGLDRADIPVLIGGQDFRIYHVYRDDSFCDTLITLLAKFWHEHVKADVPPPVANTQDVLRLFPEDDGTVVTATDEIALKHAELTATKAAIAQETAAKEALEFDIKSFMGPAGQLLLDSDGQILATWKAHQRAEKTIRTFRLKEAA